MGIHNPTAPAPITMPGLEEGGWTGGPGVDTAISYLVVGICLLPCFIAQGVVAVYEGIPVAAEAIGEGVGCASMAVGSASMAIGTGVATVIKHPKRTIVKPAAAMGMNTAIAVGTVGAAAGKLVVATPAGVAKVAKVAVVKPTRKVTRKLMHSWLHDDLFPNSVGAQQRKERRRERRKAENAAAIQRAEDKKWDKYYREQRAAARREELAYFYRTGRPHPRCR